MPVNVDIEVTNRCNADCHFCPRSATPHEGLMSEAVFDKALERAIEYRVAIEAEDPVNGEVVVSLCGLGEPLVNPRTPSWAKQVKDEGFSCVTSSNGALLDERRGTALLESGVDSIWINVGAIEDEYESVYKLPWERTFKNVVNFAELARDTGTEVLLVLVDYRQDPDYTESLKSFWRDQGISHFVEYDILNRGGSLFVDHMQFEQFPENVEARRLIDKHGSHAVCPTPFVSTFIGYDGRYYLCCSDWKKEVSFDTVFDRSILDTFGGKVDELLNKGTVCRTCNVDPINLLTDEMRASSDGSFDADKRAQELVDDSRRVLDKLASLTPDVRIDMPTPRPRRHRPRIPVIGR